MSRVRSVYAHSLETISALHARYMSGEDPADLSAEINISKGALLSQFHHKWLGSREKRHWWSSSELAAAKQRILKGDSLDDVGRRFGVTGERLYRALLKWGFNPTPHAGKGATVLKRKEDFKIFTLRQRGLSYSQIAREMGWQDSLSGQRRVGRRIKSYCEMVGMPIPLIGEVLRRDGTRRRVGYSQRIKDTVKHSMAARMGKDYT